MAEQDLRNLLKQLHQSLSSHNYSQSNALLSRAKIALLKLNALLPTPQTSQQHLRLARETLELGALTSIHLKDPESFTRYFQQLQPFYSLPENVLPREGGNASKITGLYLLLLLSMGDYAGFHTLLETLEVAAAQAREQGKGGKGLEDDVFIQYPIRLEQALMEGAYDKVWGETTSERVPSEEFGVFSEVSYSSRPLSGRLSSSLRRPLANLCRASRSSSTPFDPKSHPAPSERTPAYPSRTARTCSSLTAKAPSYNSRGRETG